MRPLWARVWKATQQTFSLYGAINGEQRSAAFAYYVLFSLFPLFALLLSIGSSFFGTEEISSALGSLLPLDAAQQRFLWESVEALERSRGGVGVLSAAVLLWCSLRFFQALVNGVNRAWHTIGIPWWQMPLKNLIMVAVLCSALFAGLLIPALLQGLGAALRAAADFLHEHFPAFDVLGTGRILDATRYLLGGVVLFYSFTMLYMLAPRVRVRFAQIWLPALCVTVALQACQVSFVNVLPRIVNYGIYGAVGGMMFVLMWVYVSGAIIMLGGCLCAVLAGRADLTPSTREY